MHGGDLTRSTFDPSKHYSGVRLQQGRVQLDADWNEQVDIAAHRDRTAAVDAFGAAGTPRADGGFVLAASPDGSDLLLSTGRCWVRGVLCETPTERTSATVTGGTVDVAATVLDGATLAVHDWVSLAGPDGDLALARVSSVDAATGEIGLAPAPPADAGPLTVRRIASYTRQPHLPGPERTTPDGGGPPTPDLADGQYLAYLDVWERTVTALEAPGIREPALGGPDTATRTQAVWQLRLLPLAGSTGKLTCADDLQAWTAGPFAPPTGRMAAWATAPQDQINICTPAPAGGFTGLENQLYRVQVRELTADGRPVILWSRENASVAARWESSGAGTLVVSRPGPDDSRGFASGDLVELADDSLLLHGRPGTLVRLSAPPAGSMLTVDPASADGPATGDSLNRADFGDGALVRRWDCTATIPVTFGDEIHLERGVRVRFTQGTYRVGDYWLVPARTAVADVDWPADGQGPLARPPHGVEHRFAHLGTVQMLSGTLTATPCLPEIPSLTTLTAADVAVDGGVCDLPRLATVQDALDRLCLQHDLRRHHRLLHGWGIVCGLRVRCGPDDGEGRRTVTVEPGSALDPAGNDLELTSEVAVDVLERLLELAEADPELIDANGDADLCLTMSMTERGPDGTPALELSPFRPGVDDTIGQALEDTLLMDFYDECIKGLHEWLTSEFEPSPDDPDAAVSPQRQLVAALTNLVTQVVNPGSGRNVFLSPREDSLLQRFYTGLRTRLQSESFCAMFDGARTPPAYPDMPPGLDTVFGAGGHTRVRMRPGGKEAWTVGPGLNPIRPTARVHRYDLETGTLVEQIDPVAGTEERVDTGTGAVTDVAFSPDGKLVYVAVPTQDENNTIFRVGRVGGPRDPVDWQELATICGVKLVSLATTAEDPNFVYAVGHRKVVGDANGKAGTRWHSAGMYRLEPAALDPNAQAMSIDRFFPTGHFAVTAGGLAVAAAMSEDTEVGAYTTIVPLMLPSGQEAGPRISLPASGADDITVVEGRVPVVAAVIKPSDSPKAVVSYRVRDGSVVGDPNGTVVHGGNSSVALAATGGVLAVALGDEYVLRAINPADGTLAEHRVPLQVGPVSLATTSGTQVVVALNYVSNTLSVVPFPVLVGEMQVDRAALAQYGAGMLEAYSDLLGGFLQYLKDCFFDHFLVRCPEPTGKEVLYLAAISVRGKQVYRVCNFSRRRYVKSFPAVGRWLSAVPVLPLLSHEFARAACAGLTPFFARQTVDPHQRGRDRVSVQQLSALLTWGQSQDIDNHLDELLGRSSMFARSMASASQRATKRPRRRGGAPVNRRTVGQQTEVVVHRLEREGVEVTTAPVGDESVLEPISRMASYFRTARSGDEVVLFEENGKVRYFEVRRSAGERAARSARSAATLPDAAALEARLAALEAEIAELRKTRPATRRKPTDKS